MIANFPDTVNLLGKSEYPSNARKLQNTELFTPALRTYSEKNVLLALPIEWWALN